MESQILYESLTKPKCDLDKNMNKTVEVTNDENNETVSNTSANGHSEQNGGSGLSNVIKSKLKEQLESSLSKPFADKSLSDVLKQDVMTQPSDEISSNALAPDDKAESAGNSQNEVASSAFSPQVQSTNIASSSDIKSETSSLPSPGVISNRSLTTSPQPPASSMVTSPQEVSSSKSYSNSSKMREKRRRRGSAWTDDETEYLMEVWAKQAELNKQKGGEESVTCAPVYRLISKSMAEQGWDKTWEQCKTRIHTLKRAYKITKDEIAEGCQTITYCRHFDKLEIICYDNPQITPGMLAANLEQKRKQRGTQFKGKKQPVRRKLTVGENPNLVKKANTFNSLPNISSFSPFQGHSPSLSSAEVTVSAPVSTTSNSVWYPPLPSQQQQQQLQHQTQSGSDLNQSIQFTQQPLQTSGIPAVPQYPYHVTPSADSNSIQPAPYTNVEVNNNTVNVKSEKLDTVNTGVNAAQHIEQQNKQWSAPYSQQPTSAQKTPSAGSDIERMRLDLEMRKLEVERNKIEMEERQRREDRDHQYRMMQLLLFGLGQQNIPQLLSGQGADVTHAHSTDLSRALESGLVPGSQKANEKGLSFSEL